MILKVFIKYLIKIIKDQTSLSTNKFFNLINNYSKKNYSIYC